MLANNETGVIQPLKELMKEIKRLNVNHGRICPLFVHTDAAQAIGKIKVDIDELKVDYLTIVGHKFYGKYTVFFSF
jgi:selenocysteine lyase